MSLADHYDEGKEGMGGQFLGPGMYVLKVCDFRTREARTGNTGVEFQCVNVTGKLARTQRFWLTHAAMKMLASFGIACGITKQEMASIDPDDLQSFIAFVGRVFVGTVTAQENNDKYHEISRWAATTDANASLIEAVKSVPVATGKFQERDAGGMAPQSANDYHQSPYQPGEYSPQPESEDIPF